MRRNRSTPIPSKSRKKSLSSSSTAVGHQISSHWRQLERSSLRAKEWGKSRQRSHQYVRTYQPPRWPIQIHRATSRCRRRSPARLANNPIMWITTRPNSGLTRAIWLFPRIKATNHVKIQAALVVAITLSLTHSLRLRTLDRQYLLQWQLKLASSKAWAESKA